jgi:PAS domain S-box-containing protein
MNGPSPGGGEESSDIADDDLLRLALETAPAGIIIVGPAQTIVLVNKWVEDRFGFSRDEMVGQPSTALFPDSPIQPLHVAPDTRPAASLHAVAAGNGLVRHGRCKDGSGIAVEVVLNPVSRPDGLYIIASLANGTGQAREDAQRRAQEALDFERLVSDLSATFVNVDSEHVDVAIQEAQRRICWALDIDRSTIFQVLEGEQLGMTHTWSRTDEPLIPIRVTANEYFPWSWAKVLSGETAAFEAPEDIPDPVERDNVRYFGTKSRVTLPLWIGGKVAGSIGFSATRTPRHWTADVVNRLQLIGQVFAGAIAARRADIALRASEARFRTMADNSPVMIWVDGPDKLCTWLNRQWLEFVGQTLEHQIGNGWSNGIHPDDVAAALRTYNSAFDAREPFTMEYRLHRHDGEWRWILDKGRPNYAADGTFLGYLGSCIDLTDEKSAKTQLEDTLSEVQRLRDQLHTENVYLRNEVQERVGSGPIVGRSQALRRVLQQIEQVAPTDSTVLLLGETGTGKELFASEIHARSARRGRTMVRVNCAAIPAGLIESELFGREKGAYTGAATRQAGRFELADHSTIFLDEIGDLPLDVQVKLLRVIEERQIERLGSSRSIRIDTRIIAATHRDLPQRVAEGLFREDLYYRLNVFPVHVPPLRERDQDIPLLIWRFVDEFSKTLSKRIESIPRETLEALQKYPWPGNVRELRNCVERAMIVASGPKLLIPVPSVPATDKDKEQVRLEDVEREHIRRILETSAWRVRGAGGAAARLGLKPTTLETRMAKLGLRRPGN